jgi:hypothetical protein
MTPLMDRAEAIAVEPRPYGRQPVALRGLADSIASQLERELRDAAVDSYVHVKAFWLRTGSDRYGWPDYRHAYIWVAPVVMNPKLCELIEPFVAKVRGVEQTDRGGSDPNKPLRPFVFAVVDLGAVGVTAR